MANVFEVMKNRFDSEVGSKGFVFDSGDSAAAKPWALYRGEAEAIMIGYSKTDKRFYLYRGAADADKKDLERVQEYYFDESDGDGEKEAPSVALDFADTLTAPVKASKERIAQITKPQKGESDDSIDAVFFVNRIPSALPECRMPLLQHKEYYGKVLPVKFCEETALEAFKADLKHRDMGRIRPFCELLTTGYEKGDMDTKSIVVHVLLNAITDEAQQKLIEDNISDTLKKAWANGKKFIGKEVKPEKLTAMKKLAAASATGERLQVK